MLARELDARAGPAAPAIAATRRAREQDASRRGSGWRGCPRCRAACRASPMRSATAAATGSVARSAPRGLSAPRQLDAELAAPPRRCARRRARRPSPRPAAARARARARCPRRRSARRRAARTGVKSSLDALGRDAAARVLHARPPQPRRGRRSRRRARTEPPGAVVLDGVGEEVEQHLHEPLPVGVHERVARRASVLDERDAALLRERAHEPERLVQHRRERAPARARSFCAPGLDARDLQHLVDEVQQVPAGLEDVLARLAPAPAGSSARASSWAKPRMVFSGVRSSWLMRDRNSLLARLARSASSLARASAASARLRSVTSVRCRRGRRGGRGRRRVET